MASRKPQSADFRKHPSAEKDLEGEPAIRTEPCDRPQWMEGDAVTTTELHTMYVDHPAQRVITVERTMPAVCVLNRAPGISRG